MTHEDESISLTESPGSTLVERNSHRALLGLGLTDSFRHLHPYTRKYTCFSTWSKWAGPDDEAAKRIDLILSPMLPLDAIILPRNDFSDHTAVYAEYLINTTAPTKQLSPALHNAQPTTISGLHIANQKAQLPTSRAHQTTLTCSSQRTADDDIWFAHREPEGAAPNLPPHQTSQTRRRKRGRGQP